MNNTIKSFDQVINEGNDVVDSGELGDFLSVVKRIMSKDPSMEADVDMDDHDYFTITIKFPEYECTIVGLINTEPAYPNALFADWYRGDKHVDVRGNEQIKEMLADNYAAFAQYLTYMIKSLRK